MALWYKAWLESRVRFLASALVLVFYCVSFVEQAQIGFPPVFEPHVPYSTFVWRGIYNGVDTLLFVVVALMLGLGGLRRERANGTAGFTLALPVTRVELLQSRVIVAMLQVAALAAIPAALVPPLSVRIGHPYPVSHAVRFAVMFGVCGAVWVAAGVVWSSIVTAEHTAAVAVLATPVVYRALVGGTRLNQWPAANLFDVMSAARLDVLDARTSLFAHGLPWPLLLILLAVAFGLLGVSAVITVRDDF